MQNLNPPLHSRLPFQLSVVRAFLTVDFYRYHAQWIRTRVPSCAAAKTTGRTAPPPALRAGFCLNKQCAIELFVEPDALQSDARSLQRATRVELTCFVHVLRRRVLAADECLFDESLSRLQGENNKDNVGNMSTGAQDASVPQLEAEPILVALCRAGGMTCILRRSTTCLLCCKSILTIIPLDADVDRHKRCCTCWSIDSSGQIHCGPAVRSYHLRVRIALVEWSDIVAVLFALRAPRRRTLLENSIVRQSAKDDS